MGFCQTSSDLNAAETIAGDEPATARATLAGTDLSLCNCPRPPCHYRRPETLELEEVKARSRKKSDKNSDEWPREKDCEKEAASVGNCRLDFLFCSDDDDDLPRTFLVAKSQAKKVLSEDKEAVHGTVDTQGHTSGLEEEEEEAQEELVQEVSQLCASF